MKIIYTSRCTYLLGWNSTDVSLWRTGAWTALMSSLRHAPKKASRRTVTVLHIFKCSALKTWMFSSLLPRNSSPWCHWHEVLECLKLIYTLALAPGSGAYAWTSGQAWKARSWDGGQGHTMDTSRVHQDSRWPEMSELMKTRQPLGLAIYLSFQDFTRPVSVVFLKSNCRFSKWIFAMWKMVKLP